MTIKDVAEYSGVSVSSVSRVLNDHPDVSESVREKVLEAVRVLHYVPNNSARDLSRTKTDAIGLIVRGAGNPFFTPIIRSIEKCILDAGYTMEILQI
ncbi:MAG: LacI family DNA-binding transcriptional regulator, partial [Eubacterium sp.]|nr:LacI family DNA-binding transcriptional regulator [Eubacterium sp.]